MKYIFFIILVCSFVSCEKEDVETGQITINFSIDLSKYSVGVFDAVHYSSSFNYEPRLALIQQKITGRQMLVDNLLPGNYIVVILDLPAYLKGVQVLRNRNVQIVL